MDTAESLAADIKRNYKERLVREFPYADCRKLAKGFEDEFEGFIPDLDMYLYEIWSPCGATRLLEYPPSELLKLRQKLARSFFERHPQYQPLRDRITVTETPYLHQELLIHDEARLQLLKLIDLLLTRQDAVNCGP